MNLKQFATKDHPIRASQLPHLVSCSFRSVLMFLKEFEDSVGTAANTGSAVHKAIEYMHKYNKSFDDCIIEAKACQDLYPKVDWNEVRLFFRPYYEDPRNQPPDAEFLKKPNGEICIEESFLIEIENPQEKENPIVLQGTFDQIRLVKDLFNPIKTVLYDYKSGSSMSDYETLLHHTMQLAGYFYGAKQKGYEIDEVGIIYGYNYRKRGAGLPSPENIFLPVMMTYEWASILMQEVVRKVNQIRYGESSPVPGHHCQKCPAGTHTTCLPLYQDLKVRM